MTKREMEQYLRWKHAIADHQDELYNGDLETVDTVAGSMLEHPYVQRTVVIQGMDMQRVNWLKWQIAELAAKCERVETFVADVEDYEMRAFLRMHYMEGLSWTKVRKKMRIRYIGSNALRMRVERFLKKI